MRRRDGTKIRIADQVVALETPREMDAVSMWFRNFPQVDDADVVALLSAADLDRGDSPDSDRHPPPGRA